MNLIAISYSLALIAFTALGVLAAIGWRGKPIGLRLLGACAAMVLWSIAVIGSSFLAEPKFLPVFLSELLRDVALIWVIFGVAGDSVPRAIKIGSYCVAVAVALLGLARDAFGGWTVFAPTADQLMLGSGLLFSFLGLVSLEQTYRNARAPARHALRYLILGFGALFAYDLFLYAQAALYQQIRADAWLVRGAVNALSAPLIAIAMRRNPEWSLDIFVSRQVVFYTTAFLAVGVYLLFVAIGGY
ncbi:MAG TPA: hypothetical protein VFX76_09250, partial [Roseiflexaceae bacterium]|nr:hypothetical protein [Roseiflexaceae bacterium]